MDLHCAGCREYMGEITKGKVKKGLVVLCPRCEAARVAMADRLAEKRGVEELFGGLFKSGRKP